MERKSFYDWCIENNRLDILEEWNYEKNNISPKDVSLQSAIEVWWQCKEGHEWLRKLNHRFGHINKGQIRGCPICANQQILEGYNDLATRYPEIAKEWNYEKNSPLLPTQVFPGSSKKVWWKCPKGHEYQTSINNRTNTNSKCPECLKDTQTSFAELAILFYLSKYFKNIKHRYLICGNECDIYIEDLKVAIEYDGQYWHNENRDEQKYQKLSDIGISLINIREPECPRTSNPNAYYLKNLEYSELENAIKYIFNFIDKNIKPDIHISNNKNNISNFSLKLEEENSLEKNYPELMKEWDYTKNKDINPKYITSRSGIKVWWICPEGHSYKSEIRDRTKNHTKCPICANKQALKGFNDLTTKYPEIAEEWNYEKNFPLLPTQVTSGSHKKVWWKCKYCNFEWKSEITNRVQNLLCPNCKDGQIHLLNISSANKNDNNKTTINSGNNKINLLKKDCQTILSFFKQGIFLLNNTEVMDESILSISLYAIYSGFERMLKLICMFQYLNIIGDFPTEEYIDKNIRKHNITKMIDDIMDNHSSDSSLKKFRDDTIYSNIIDSLEYFSKYENNDFIFNKNTENNLSICSYWHINVDKQIMEKYNVQVTNTDSEKQQFINKCITENIRGMISILKNNLLSSAGYWKFIFDDIFQEY